MSKIRFVSLFVLLALLLSAVPGAVMGQEPIVERPNPTPVPPSFFLSEGQEMAITTERGVKSNEVYYSIAYFSTPPYQQVAVYGARSSATGTNSLQAWCDATYIARHGIKWYRLDSIWGSTWSSSLQISGSKSLVGEKTLHAHGTHLFDYCPGNWVWRYSDESENSWD